MGTMTNQRFIAKPDRRQRLGHQYHAEANLLSGVLERPIVQSILPQAQLSLLDWRGGHLYQRAQGFDLEALVSFKSGYTRVSGYRSEKKQTFVTVATSVIEGLNVFDVLTADRVVAQVATSHPMPKDGDLGHVPDVTFLGTQFENLKVTGYDVKVAINPKICGERPANDVPYLFNNDFLDEAREQVDEITGFGKVPKELEKQSAEFLGECSQDIEVIKRLRERRGEDDEQPHKVNCSLVESVILPKSIPGVEVVGNVMYVRDFGIVTLGNISVERRLEDPDPSDPYGKPSLSNYFEIKMFDLRLGCVGEGRIIAASGSGNGTGRP